MGSASPLPPCCGPPASLPLRPPRGYDRSLTRPGVLDAQQRHERERQPQFREASSVPGFCQPRGLGALNFAVRTRSGCIVRVRQRPGTRCRFIPQPRAVGTPVRRCRRQRPGLFSLIGTSIQIVGLKQKSDHNHPVPHCARRETTRYPIVHAHPHSVAPILHAFSTARMSPTEGFGMHRGAAGPLTATLRTAPRPAAVSNGPELAISATND